MRIRISPRRLGGTIGMALVLGALCVTGSAPAYGRAAATTSMATSTAEQKDQQQVATFEADIAQLKHDFALLPPEINSMLIHSGPGAGSMQAAATAWEGLARELQSEASSFESVTTELTSGSWLGPSSSAAAAAVSPYVTWMHATAQQAEQAAAQANAAAAAFEQRVKTETTSGHG